MIADFLDHAAGLPGAHGDAVAAAVEATGAFVQPLVDAYLLEGSRHFNAPAQIGGDEASKCVQGGCPSSSGWPLVAQRIIAGVDGNDDNDDDGDDDDAVIIIRNEYQGVNYTTNISNQCVRRGGSAAGMGHVGRAVGLVVCVRACDGLVQVCTYVCVGIRVCAYSPDCASHNTCTHKSPHTDGQVRELQVFACVR